MNGNVSYFGAAVKKETLLIITKLTRSSWDKFAFVVSDERYRWSCPRA